MPLAFVCMGVNCNPERRACGFNDGIDECGFRAPSATTVPACINFCAPIPVDDPMTTGVDEREGARCVVDPCETNLWMVSGVYLCPPQWSCDPDTASPLSDYGTCVRNGMTFGSECDPSSRFETPCEGNTYCRSVELCSALPASFTPTGDGICVIYEREGEACDGNWDEAGTCAPCAPGLDCKDLGDGDHCYRPCADVDDCPCDTATTEFSCENDYCNFCYATGVPGCDPELGACCDENATCDDREGDIWTEAICCYDLDVSCDPEAPEDSCCRGLACNPSTDKCDDCLMLGEEYDEEHPLGCCAHLDHRIPSTGGMVEYCLPECDDEEECGRCDHHDALYSDDIYKYTCHDDGPPTCDMPAAAPLSDSTNDDDCDGYDDDCDGQFDEGFDEGGACTGELQNGHCSGTSWPGTYHCPSDDSGFDPNGGDEGKGWVCVHVPGRDYCAINFTSDPPAVEMGYVGESPGWGSGSSGCDSGPDACFDDADCSPDRYCGYWGSDTFTTCIAKHPSNFSGYTTDCGEMCWTPGENNGTLVHTCP